jgi:hypothetical protein
LQAPLLLWQTVTAAEPDDDGVSGLGSKKNDLVLAAEQTSSLALLMEKKRRTDDRRHSLSLFSPQNL